MKIVVGVDDSVSSKAAVRRAMTMGEKLGADLHLVFVAHVPAAVMAAMSGLPAIGDDFAEAQRSNVWESIDPLLAECSLAVERVNLEGYPPDVLVEYANEKGADLIMVGSRGRGDLASLVLGSTSHRVVNHASCDVLVVRERQQP